MSALVALLDAAVALQTSLALTYENVALPVVKRALPKREEAVDAQAQVTVSGAQLVDEVKRIAFGSAWFCVYSLEVTLVTPADKDALIGVDPNANWREATRAAFMKPGALSAKKVEVAQAPHLDRGKLAQGYNYTQVALRVTTYERRT